MSRPVTSTPSSSPSEERTIKRPALATAGTVFGLLLLLGGKAATAPSPISLGQTAALPASLSISATGPTINTRYGPVRVKVDIAKGHIVEVTAVQLPTGGKSGQIADYSGPILREEALAAQGAGIQAVSGATYTSEGYAQSLQAALDQLSASIQTASAVGASA